MALAAVLPASRISNPIRRAHVGFEVERGVFQGAGTFAGDVAAHDGAKPAAASMAPDTSSSDASRTFPTTSR